MNKQDIRKEILDITYKIIQIDNEIYCTDDAIKIKNLKNKKYLLSVLKNILSNRLEKEF